MRIISLNVWGGRVYSQLEEFIKTRAPTTDVFCFQEVFDGAVAQTPEQIALNKRYAAREEENVYDLGHRIAELLPGFDGAISSPYSDFGERLGIFYSKKLAVSGIGETEVADSLAQEMEGVGFTIGSRMQWVSVIGHGTIAHCHGIWQLGGKGDTPERLKQSERLLAALAPLPGEKVLMGDFNLNPETRSIAILSGKMRNLVAEYGVHTTRSSLSAPSKGRFADYAFVTSGVKLRDFQVLGDVASDHLPLYIETE